jgi:chromosome segregation protein
VRLTSLKLSGFKSFVDPTNFQVPGQLVGVVGPNGCGKSNIMDAVRWVLGESKASELRGESMQDVIFNGSNTRKPAGRASVELVFDNSDGRAAGQWSQYTEIAVKRTLTRDGTSSYYINNQAVRRKDVQDIFLGTGLGPRAYAIIGQGMISRIIEARPEDLRIFLEEAAGVSKYKERRRETENRLHDTRENLTRIEDILRELTANLQKLEVQAAVAQKFRELQADQDEKQKLLWLLRKNEAKAEQERFFQDIEKAQLELEEQTARLRHVETELEQMRQAHYAAGERMHTAQGHLYQTNSEIGSLEAQIRFVIESRSRLQAQLAALTAQREQWQRQGQQQQDELAEADMHLEEHGMRVEQAQHAAQMQSDNVPALEQAWRDAQLNINESGARIMQIQKQIELESAHQRNASNILASLGARRERLVQEKNGMSMPDTEQLASLNMQLEEKQAALEEARQQLEAAQQQQPQLEEERRAAQQELNTETANNAQLEARLAALRQLQENVQTQGKVHPWLTKHELGDLPRLWQQLHIEHGWETALESVLRERTSALEVLNLDWAKAFFSDAPPAKLAFFSSGNSGVALEMDVPGGLQPFLSLLQLNDPGLRALMQDWLHNIFVAEDAATAFAERIRLPAGACFVTRQGHVIGKSSVRFYAADSEQDGLLARQQEIENLARQLRAQQLLADEVKSRAVRTEAVLSQAMQRLQDLRQRVNGLTQEVHGLQIQVMKLSEVLERFTQRSSRIEADLAEIATQELEQHQAKTESEAKFEQLDIELAQLQEMHEGRQNDYLAKERQLNDARARLRDLERTAQEAQFAEKAHRGRMDELKRNISTALDQSAQLFASMQQGQLELESLDDQAAQAGLQILLDTRSDQERALSDARHELDQLTQKLRHMDEARMQTERGLQPQRDASWNCN